MPLSLEEALKFAPKGGGGASSASAASRYFVSPQKEGDGAGIFGTGKTALFKALEVVDTPRRVVASTLQESIDAAQGEGFSFSDWKEQVGDAEFGFGKILANEDILQGSAWYERWGARAVGFTGDVFLDPLTYLTAGSHKVVQIGRKGLSRRAWGYADNVSDDVLRAVNTSRDDLVRIGSQIEQVGLANVDAADIAKLGDVAAKVGDIDGAAQLAGGLHFTIPGTGRIVQRVSGGAVKPRSVQLTGRSAARKGKKAGNAVSRFVQAQRTAGRRLSRDSKILSAFGGADGALKRQVAEEVDPKKIRDLTRALDTQGSKRLIQTDLQERSIAALQGLEGDIIDPDSFLGLRDEVIEMARDATRPVQRAGDVEGAVRTNVNDVYDFVTNLDDATRRVVRERIAEGGRVTAKDFKGVKVGDDFFGVPILDPGRAAFSYGKKLSVNQQMDRILRDLPQSMENIFSRDMRTALGANFDVLAHRAGEAWQVNTLAGFGLAEMVESVNPRLARALSGADLPVGPLTEEQAAQLLGRFGDDLVTLTPEQAFEVRDAILNNADAYIAKVEDAQEATRLWAKNQLDDMAFDPRQLDQSPTSISQRLEANLDRINEMTVNNSRRIEDLRAGRAKFTGPKNMELDFRVQAEEIASDGARQAELAAEADELIEQINAGTIQGDAARVAERAQWHRNAATVADMEAANARTQADEVMREAGRKQAKDRFAPLIEEARIVEEGQVERIASSAGKVTADQAATYLSDPDVLDAVNEMVMKDGMSMIDWGRMADEDIIEGIREVSKFQSPESMRNVMKHYDNALNAFKAAALLSPGFHFRNLYGGVFNNWLAGVDQASYGKVASMIGSDAAQAGGKGFATKRRLTRLRGAVARVSEEDQQIYDLLKDHSGVLSTGGLYANETDIVGAALLGDVSANPFSSRGRIALANRRLGGNVEDMLRMTLAFDTVKKGGTIQDAINNVFKYHFDYSDLSTFEQSTVRRIVPFYTWTRKNLPLQIENFITQPGKYTRYLAAKRNIEQFTEEEEIVPGYYKELLAIQLPIDIGGNTQYLTPDLPFRAAAEATDPGFILGSVSPFLRVPAEYVAGKQFFSGIPLRNTYKEVPAAMEFTPGLMHGLASIGITAQAEDGTWMMRDKHLKSFEGMLPLYGRARRVDPTADGNEDRWWGSVASTMFGIGLRSNDERAQSGERYARELAKAEAEADRRALGR